MNIKFKKLVEEAEIRFKNDKAVLECLQEMKYSTENYTRVKGAIIMDRVIKNEEA